jgi:hypothetical protein
MNDDDLRPIEGPAFSCVSAAVCALAISNVGSYIWLAFVYLIVFYIIAGIFINPLNYNSVKQLFMYCAMPATALVFVWVNLPIVAVVWGGPIVMNVVYGMSMLAPLMFFSSCLGITITSLARRKLIATLESEDKIRKVRSSLEAIGGLCTVIYGGVAWFLSHGTG